MLYKGCIDLPVTVELVAAELLFTGSMAAVWLLLPDRLLEHSVEGAGAAETADVLRCTSKPVTLTIPIHRNERNVAF